MVILSLISESDAESEIVLGNFFFSRLWMDSLTGGQHVCTDDDASGIEFGGATTYGTSVYKASFRIHRYTHSACNIHHWCGRFGTVFW